MLKRIPILVIPFGIILILILAFFAKSLFFSPGTFIGGMDVAGSFYWNEAFVKESFLSGSIPLWNPYYYCGHPFLANPSVFAFYPATLLYVSLPLPLAFNLDIVLHILIAAVGMFLFVNCITNSRKAGIASAIVYSLSGYFIERIMAGHIPLIHAAALIPLIFYFIENALRRNTARNIIIAGIILGLQMLGGDPHVSYLTSLFLALYYFIMVVMDSKSLPLNDKIKRLSFFLLIPLIAFGVSAVQTIPSLEFRSLSDRTSNTFEFVSLGSFSPAQFFLLLIPKPQTTMLSSNWEMGCYIGVLALILAFIGVFFSNYKKHALCIGILLCIAVTFILGKYTPFYYLYYKFLPMLSTFRIPARATVIFVFFMSILVGMGIKHLTQHSLNRTQKLTSMAVIIVLSVFLFFGALVMRIPLNSSGIVYAVLFLISSLILLSLFSVLKDKHIITWLFIAVLFIDSYLVYSPLVPKLSEESLLMKKPFEPILERDSGLYRINVPGFDSNLYGLPSRGMKYHYYGINGSTPIILKDYFDFIYNMSTVSPPSLFRHTFAPDLFMDANLAFSSKILGVKYAVVGSPTGYRLAQAEQYMPRAVLVHDAIISPRMEDHLAYLRDPQFNPVKTVLLEKGAPMLAQDFKAEEKSAYANEMVNIDNYKPNRIELTSQSPGDAYLLLSELYYPGWKAYVDGKKVNILRADYLLRAVHLPAGRHSISFVYKPMSFYKGSVLSLFTLLILPFFTFMYYRKGKKA